MSLGQFAQRARRIAREVEENSNRLVRTVALAVDQTLVLGTPVDEGRARSNWVVQIGTPFRETIEPYAPGKSLGLGETANASAAIAQGDAAIGGRTPGQDIYISNNLPYIRKLNEGHSQQAPAGFVEEAVQVGVQTIRGARLVNP